MTVGQCTSKFTHADRKQTLQRLAELREIWEERAAIRAIDGHLTYAEAQRMAWAGLRLPESV